MMNCIELFLRQCDERGEKPALWMPDRGLTSFRDLEALAGGAQALLKSRGIQKGDAVLLFDALGPRLYAAVIAILGLGCQVIFVEPWLALDKINRAVEASQPKIFLTGWMGRLWGMRARSVRHIPQWVSLGDINRKKCSLHASSVLPEASGIVTFTTGTTGEPKGVVRSQGLLEAQHRIIARSLGGDLYEGPDLCVFANIALTNLASGRLSLIIPQGLSPSGLEHLDELPPSFQPESVTCGPAFVASLMRHARLPGLKGIHVGGALTACETFEKGFIHWPQAKWLHVYGGSEAEPVAIADASAAVAYSRESGYFQTLYLGHPIQDIRASIEGDHLWVEGAHVCARYVGNEEANRSDKRVGENASVWHRMGDRVIQDSKGWWYAGRSRQKKEEFILEQEIYAFLGASESFIAHRRDGGLCLVGERIKPYNDKLFMRFPVLTEVVEMKIYRDKRHRARIDRRTTLTKGAPWLVG